MAAGASGLQDTFSVSQFNDVVNHRLFHHFARKSPAMAGILGSQKGVDNNGYPEFPKVIKENGPEFEFRFASEPSDWTGVGRGSEERASVTLTSYADFAGVKMKMAKYRHTPVIEDSKLRFIGGQGFKGEVSHAQEIIDLAMDGGLKTWAKAFWATGSGVMATDKVFQSAVGLISDGTEANYDTYAGAARSSSDNEPLRSLLLGRSVVDYRDYAYIQTFAGNKGGSCSLILCPEADWLQIMAQLEGKCEAVIDGDLMQFGGRKLRYAGSDICSDPFAAAGIHLVISPEWMKVRKSPDPLFEPIRQADWLEDSSIIKCRLIGQLFSEKPNAHGKINYT